MERWLFKDKRYYEGPLIREGTIEYRAYQVRIALSALKANTLVVLPTGLGKTIIAAMVMGYRLHEEDWGKCVMLTPTRPLTLQHLETLRRILKLPSDEVNAITGALSPEKRAEVWRRSKVISMTPQTLKNDLIAGRYDLRDVVLLVFDEAHRAVGNYPYVFIAERYIREAKDPLILAMTASPGSEEDKVKTICRNLFIENIEVRNENSPDVRPYVQPIYVKWHMVDLDESFKLVKATLVAELQRHLKELKERGYVVSSNASKVRLKDILEAKALLQDKMKEYVRPPKELVWDLIRLNYITRLVHALELLEAQGFHALKRYMLKLEELAKRPGSNRFLKEFVYSRSWIDIKRIIALKEDEEPHPKIGELLKILKANAREGTRTIIFTNYRDTVDLLTDILRQHGYRVASFIGQAKRGESKGLTQRQQEEIMRAFKKGEYDVLVATQVAEEGIDVAECDLVVFYDNVPSAIRYVQRRGRTGRRRAGKVVVLIARGTRDEAYYWSSLRKRKSMYSILKKLKYTIASRPGTELGIKAHTEYQPVRKENEDLLVYVDNRELTTEVVNELVKQGIRVIPRKLEVADYVVSEDVAIERKSLKDFAQSIIDLRIFKQARILKRTYATPLVILEGKRLTLGMRQEAILGALISLMVDYGIPVIWTEGPTETARYIVALAKREQREKKRRLRIKGERRPLTLEEVQLEMLSAIPGIDRILAERLLRMFRTIRDIANADPEELMSVEGIGEKLAGTIYEAFRHRYQAS